MAPMAKDMKKGSAHDVLNVVDRMFAANLNPKFRRVSPSVDLRSQFTESSSAVTSAVRAIQTVNIEKLKQFEES